MGIRLVAAGMWGSSSPHYGFLSSYIIFTGLLRYGRCGLMTFLLTGSCYTKISFIAA
nr:hypothetical protein Q903MT_gene95 [Picea sitchensis]